MIQVSEFSTYFPVGNSAVLEYTLQKVLPKTPEIHEEKNEETSIYQSVQNSIEYIIEDIYILENPEEIKMYLVSNEDLIPILLDAPERIYGIFGYTPIYLELHHDPEERWDELFIVIKTPYPPEKAIELENELFEKWFIEVSSKVNGRLNFTEEPL